MTKRELRSEAVTTRSHLHRTTLNSGAWYEMGVVDTPNGYVWVYAETGLVVFRFIWQRREHVMTEHHGHTKRGIAILAGRFARDVINGLVSYE